MASAQVTNPHLVLNRLDDTSKNKEISPQINAILPAKTPLSGFIILPVFSMTDPNHENKLNLPAHLARLGQAEWTDAAWQEAGGKGSYAAELTHSFYNDLMPNAPRCIGIENIQLFFEKNPEGNLVLYLGPHSLGTKETSYLATCIARATGKKAHLLIAGPVKRFFGDAAKEFNMSSVTLQTIENKLKENMGEVFIIVPGGTPEANASTLGGASEQINGTLDLTKAQVEKHLVKIKTIPDKTIGIAYVFLPENFTAVETRPYTTTLATKHKAPTFPLSLDAAAKACGSTEIDPAPTLFCSAITTVDSNTTAETIFDTGFIPRLQKIEAANKELLRDIEKFSAWLSGNDEAKSYHDAIRQIETQFNQHQTTCIDQHKILIEKINAETTENQTTKDLKTFLSGRHNSEVLTTYIKPEDLPAELQPLFNNYVAALKQRETAVGLVNFAMDVAQKKYMASHTSDFSYLTDLGYNLQQVSLINWWVNSSLTPDQTNQLPEIMRWLDIFSRGKTRDMREAIQQGVARYLPAIGTATTPTEARFSSENPMTLKELQRQAQWATSKLANIKMIEQQHTTRRALNSSYLLGALTLPELMLLTPAIPAGILSAQHTARRAIEVYQGDQINDMDIILAALTMHAFADTPMADTVANTVYFLVMLTWCLRLSGFDVSLSRILNHWLNRPLMVGSTS